MKKRTEPEELSQFAEALRAFLRESHPHMAHDREFIRERSDASADTFERLRRDGANVYEALELANAVLYQDLRFSRYDAIFEVVSEWFPEIAPASRPGFCLRMLSVCKSVFDKYAPGDDFQSTPAYQTLLTELAGTIQENIDTHGIQ